MMETECSLKAQIAFLEKELALYKEENSAKSGYYVLVNIQNQQIQFLRSFKIKDEISKTTKEDATYMRAKDIWENLPKMISSISELRIMLKIDPNEEKSELKKMISSESIAQEIGDNKTQEV